MSYIFHCLATRVVLISPELHSSSSGHMRLSELHLQMSGHTSFSDFSWVTFPIFWPHETFWVISSNVWPHELFWFLLGYISKLLTTWDFLSYTSKCLATRVVLISPGLHSPSSDHMRFSALYLQMSGHKSCSDFSCVSFPIFWPHEIFDLHSPPSDQTSCSLWLYFPALAHVPSTQRIAFPVL
jgi:hypothetical protein